ncbi:MAG TPA: hypothetical protein VL017_00815, partial [Devosia sp.]|nr:hypothetical protein [Devosia sp.]
MGEDVLNVPEEADNGTQRRRRGLWRALAALLALLVLITGGGLVWLDTNGGHRFIAGQINALEFENGLTIHVGRIEGSIYSKLEVVDLAIGDPKGSFAAAPRAAMDWRPFAYLSNHIDIRSLTAPLVQVKRLPELREVKSDEPLLPDIDIDVEKL